MRTLPFDLEVAKTIRSLRINKKIKQDTVAYALNMSRSNYTRLENGDWAMTLGQLTIIARELGTTPVQILLSTNDGSNKVFNASIFLEIVIDLILLIDRKSSATYSEKELDFIIKKIKSLYEMKNQTNQ
ncbi:MAG: hypothetical protein JWO32_729 [Bacteroidetes bacterium]|nr:hypothetical protein [Bacteroidota bacterium]